MSDKKASSNPIFDIWMNNQQQFLDAQSEWLKPAKVPENPFMNADFLDRSLQSWKRCEEQYNLWTKTAENWTGSDKHIDENADFASQALSYMVNPTTFMQSGFEMMERVFRKLVNGPEFADIGMLEKKLLKSSEDWQAFRLAGQRFQEVISNAWLRAYQHFSDEFVDTAKDESIAPEELLKRWLKIADQEMVTTLRSEEFLKAQKEFFSAGTAYRLKHQEFVEMWCESHTIPTRSEIDDLHKLIYELRREVRGLKKQLEKQDSGTGKKPASSPAAKAKRKKPAVKAKKAGTKAKANSTPKKSQEAGP